MDTSKAREKLSSMTNDIEKMLREVDAQQRALQDAYGRPISVEEVRAELRKYQVIVSRVWWSSVEGKLTPEIVEYLLGEETLLASVVE